MPSFLSCEVVGLLYTIDILYNYTLDSIEKDYTNPFVEDGQINLTL
jgi:hypothetical protein